VDVSGTTTNVTDYGLGPRGVEEIDKNGGLNYPIYDVHGNMVATLSRSGTGFLITNQRSYDPWGNVRLGATSGDPKGRYCANLGHKTDDESGLIYMRARYYDSTSGRFISEDSKRDGQNWFIYGTDDPINHFDASGNNDDDQSAAYYGALFYMLCYVYEGYGGADLDTLVTVLNNYKYGSQLANLFNTSPTGLGCMLTGQDDPEIISEISTAYTQTLGNYLQGIGNAPDTPDEAGELAGPALQALSAYGGACEAELFMQDVDDILSD
jgi:RHS repeat-associated protein